MLSEVKLVLGTMTMGDQVLGHDVGIMLEYFLSKGYTELDTAYVYNDGACERLLGSALASLEAGAFKLATKVNPKVTGKLDRDSVLDQFNQSLRCLGTDRVDKLYLHFPDPDTPVEYALEACAELHGQGRFSELGLSNFPAWLVAEVYHRCKQEGWMLPKVYQGLYNPLSRHAERELDQALDYYGMCFYAYNPLAGGILTNKYESGNRQVKAGRFTRRPNYLDRYWKESYFQASDQVRAKGLEYNIGIVEATYRWLAFHSMLKPGRGDAIIVGASRLEHLAENMKAMEGGPLPDALVAAFDQAWEECRPDAPEYFKFYRPE